MNQFEKLCARFQSPAEKDGMYIYFEPGRPDPPEEIVAAFVRNCSGAGVRCIIPRLCETNEDDSRVLDAMRKTYRTLLYHARRAGLKVAFNLEKIIETTVVRRAEEEGNSLRARVLDKMEYYCDQEQTFTCKRREGATPVTIAAVNRELEEIQDLRDYVNEEGVLTWNVPYGNWIVEEYYTLPDPSPNVDYLDYVLCRRYLDAAYALFADVFEDGYGDLLGAVHYADICFHAPNRRNWTGSFDAVFQKTYGFDPAPLYPHLFRTVSPDTPHAKALLFCCRAAMLQNGICRALSDFAEERGINLVSTLTEPKLAACSFVSGDAIMDNAFAPGALLDRSYLYGINSLKIAAAGAYNFGREQVSCELYRDYYQVSLPIIYKDAINAMGRGANLLMAHTENFHRVTDSFDDPSHSWRHDYASFVSRCQALLQGGRHVADIAVVYPIHSIHASVNFYRTPVEGFEYPTTPSTTDYLTLINSIAFYAGHDITLLHPDILSTRCTVQDGTVFMGEETDRESFRILVLPSAELVRLDVLRLARRLYESGGRIIATGDLPKYAFEWRPSNGENDSAYDENRANSEEIREHLVAIFGEEVLNPNCIVNVIERHNAAGGEAYWLYQSKTATDGTMMVDCVLLSRILRNFNLPQDVYLPTMPRFICTGALNNPYREFVALGLHRAVPGGGMLSHLHMRRDDVDVYYFGNTSDTSFNGKALLRGLHVLFECNPHTGTIKPLPVRYAKTRGSFYTEVQLHISSVEARILLTDPTAAPDPKKVKVFNRASVG